MMRATVDQMAPFSVHPPPFLSPLLIRTLLGFGSWSAGWRPARVAGPLVMLLTAAAQLE